ncbi:MAG TPA: PEF-CTERM sorting domain-containing protein [Methanophagales archaeon]|nr:PEF-CTERM sorting domain-containing protein [Methanophagales archaeon]
MKKIKASLMAVAVVLVLIAFVAPSSAYSIVYKDYADDGTGGSIWTYEVTCDPTDSHAISNWVVAWCNPNAVLEVLVDGKSTSWDYGTYYDGVQGIKIDYPIEKGHTSIVIIRLAGVYSTDYVEWRIKASTDIHSGTVWGPVVCATPTPIPEFSTIAIPIASILGLLFFFNHRKGRK